MPSSSSSVARSATPPEVNARRTGRESDVGWRSEREAGVLRGGIGIADGEEIMRRSYVGGLGKAWVVVRVERTVNDWREHAPFIYGTQASQPPSTPQAPIFGSRSSRGRVYLIGLALHTGDFALVYVAGSQHRRRLLATLRTDTWNECPIRLKDLRSLFTV